MHEKSGAGLWRQQAACLNRDLELFFPIEAFGAAQVQLQRAKQVCAGCDVRTDCLQFAREAGVDHGVWGGLSEEERRSLKHRRAEQHPLPSAAPADGYLTTSGWVDVRHSDFEVHVQLADFHCPEVVLVP